MPSSAHDRAIAALKALAPLTSGYLGLSAIHIESGLTLELNEKDHFPMASTVKVAVALTVMEMEESGEIKEGEMLEVNPEDVSIEYPEVPWGGHSGASFSIANLLEMMITRSDNTSTDVLLKRIGGMETVRKFLSEKMGIKVGDEASGGEINPVYNTKGFLQLAWPELFDFNDPTPLAVKYANLDTEKPRLAALYQASLMPPNPEALDNAPRDKASPAGMAKMLAKVAKCEGVSARTKTRLFDVMERCLDKRRWRAGLPSGVKAGNKSGTIRGCQNDIG